jgi:hypothetical protein
MVINQLVKVHFFISKNMFTIELRLSLQEVTLFVTWELAQCESPELIDRQNKSVIMICKILMLKASSNPNLPTNFKVVKIA